MNKIKRAIKSNNSFSNETINSWLYYLNLHCNMISLYWNIYISFLILQKMLGMNIDLQNY